ncbi:MAG: ChbG/HpnK family deacetylase [Acidobacteriaceae bacterium]
MLLVNADDFGLTPGINRSIVELHAARALSSATLMATGAFFDDAVRLAHDHPTLEVGCHILLVDGIPALPPRKIPSLCPNGQTFRPSLTHFVRDLLTYRIRAAEITAEATAQILRLQGAGLRVSHIDTHKHTHLFSGVLRPLLLAARACGIPAIRNPFEPAWALRATPNASLLRRLAVVALSTEHRGFLRRVRLASLATPSGTIGVLATGTSGPDAVRSTLRALLAAQPPDSSAVPSSIWELVSHPGHLDPHLDAVHTRLRGSRAHEHDALRELLPNIPLASWRDLGTNPTRSA